MTDTRCRKKVMCEAYSYVCSYFMLSERTYCAVHAYMIITFRIAYARMHLHVYLHNVLVLFLASELIERYSFNDMFLDETLDVYARNNDSVQRLCA